MTDKKVLFFLKTPPPIHGSTLMNQRVLNSAIIKKAFYCEFFQVSFSEKTDEIGKDRRGKIKKLITYLNQFRGKIKIFKPEIVYFALSPTGAAFLKDLLFIALIKFKGIKIIYHLHGKGTNEYAKKSALNNKLVQFVFKNEHAICLSNNLTYDVDRFTKNIHIIPNGIEDEAGELKNREYNEIPHFVFLSNFIVNKGILVFLKALKQLDEGNHSFKFSLIGNSTDVSDNDLSGIIQEYKLQDHLHHLGPIYGKEKFSFLKECDVLVFPTYYEKETFGLVLLEGMSCGLAVIGTDLGAIPEIIDDGKTGFIVKQNDVNSLYQKMEIFLKNRHLIKEMGMQGRRKFETDYSIQVFEKKVVNAINEVKL